MKYDSAAKPQIKPGVRAFAPKSGLRLQKVNQTRRKKDNSLEYGASGGIFKLSITRFLKLLAKSPDERYQTAAELLQELETVGKFQGASA